MEVLMPTVPLDSNVLSECKDDIQFDDFFLAKLAYINCSSDLDVFQLQGEERINHLICAWDTAFVLCRRCDAESRNIPEFLHNYLTNLVHYSLNIWFSLEWENCEFNLCCSLLVAMFRLHAKLVEIPQLDKLNWKYLMNLGVRPWSCSYFKDYISAVQSPHEKNTSSSIATFSIEIIEPPATMLDIFHINKEGLIITLLRLIKLFDAGCMESVKKFSICAISVWNQDQSNSTSSQYDDDLKRCLNMICHTYLMAVFEKDSAVGFEIDNMINNIRFYHKCITDSQKAEKRIIEANIQDASLTPCHLIALTSVRLNQTVQEFIESVLGDLSRENCSTIFGAVSHAYATYLLASILVEMNQFNKGDFTANIEKYKRTMRFYVVERERSELFILEEVHKEKLQAISHNVTCTIQKITNLKSAICKGNHSSNLVNHKPSNIQSEQERAELFETENEKRYDPVFQTMPNTALVTNEFYDVLSKTKYKGWHFAKLVLLLKIIGRELNDIEKWCYHPGLTTQFMMTLEHRLAKRFEDLALIFQDHIFMEQEFWLTAFYLRPVRYYYEKVLFCGTRFFRTVNLLNKGDRDEVILNNKKSADKDKDKDDEVICAFMNAKYGLLSSTFDVTQIAKMSSGETAANDYDVLAKALRTLRLPENIIKDLLTVTFSPRHANFTWAAEWSILRKRCKMLLTNPAYKRELVESNMAEANDRLKYLKIDYDKYKNWPQLDYGSIEEGYENDYIGDELDDSDDDDDDIMYMENKKKNQQKNQSTKIENESDEIDQSPNYALQFQEEFPDIASESYSGMKRISARRAAAVIASAMLKEETTTTNTKVVKKKDESPKAAAISSIIIKEEPKELEPNHPAEEPHPIEEGNNTKDFIKKSIEYTNSTTGFIPIADIWECAKKIEKQNDDKFGLDEQPSSLSSRRTFGILNKVSDLCRKLNGIEICIENGKNDEEEDDNISESSDGDSIDRQSNGHGAMNVSDTEFSSSDERSEDAWAELLPSHIIKKNSQRIENDSPIEEETPKVMENVVIVDCCMEKKTNEISVEAEESSGNSSSSTHAIIQSVKIFPPLSFSTSFSAVSDKRNIAIVPADCTDANAADQDAADVVMKASNDSNHDEEFAVSTTTTTTTTEISNLVPLNQYETETTIDSTACSKTEEHESMDEIVSIETTTTGDSSIHTPIRKDGEIEKVEVHSTTQNIEVYPNNNNNNNSNSNNNNSNNNNKKQLTGKPKSFIEFLSTQLLSEDTSSSQSSSGTHANSAQRVGSSTSSSEVIDVDAEPLRKRKAELIELCLRKKCFVVVGRIELSRSELRLAREPIVRVKRLNMDKFIKENAERQKRRTKTKPKYFYMEDNSSPTPKVNNKMRKRKNVTPAGSESDDEYQPEQSKDPATTYRPANRKLLTKTLPQRQERAGAKSFSVVPRSASGLKVCISSLRDIRPPVDCIEISSSSESDLMEVSTYPYSQPIEFASIGHIIADENDPLFEEEADIDMLR